MSITFENVNGHTVCRIEVRLSRRPVYAHGKQTMDFYVRLNNGTRSLTTSKRPSPVSLPTTGTRSEQGWFCPRKKTHPCRLRRLKVAAVIHHLVRPRLANAFHTSSSTATRAEATDTGWIAHFYLSTNCFYSPDLIELTLVEPPPLRLSGPRPVPGTALPVTLYPHPWGNNLGLVEGLDRPLDGAQVQAYDVTIPLLDELSVRYDVPLPVAHSMVVGVPSGILYLYFGLRPKAKAIETESLPRCPYPELRDAYTLYREAVSSNNPLHAFLTVRKVYEEAVYVRKRWGAKQSAATRG